MIVFEWQPMFIGRGVDGTLSSSLWIGTGFSCLSG